MEKIIQELKRINKIVKKDLPPTKRFIYKAVEDVFLRSKPQQSPILLGLRRVGKSTIFKQILANNNKTFYIPFESVWILALSDVEFSELINALYEEGYRNFLFDEIQIRNTWDTLFFSLFNSFPDCRFALTGSSSLNLVQRETGLDRTRVLRISTLTFDEFCNLTNNDKTKENFELFLGRGGFPGYLNKDIPTNELFATMENDILGELIKNDITASTRNIEPTILLKIIRFIASKTNGEFKKNAISKYIGNKFNNRDVDRYIRALIDANVVKKIEKIDARGLQPLKESESKIYINPHLLLWMHGVEFKKLDNKFKGHIVESYWLTWVDSVNKIQKHFYYMKDNNYRNQEIDFVSLKSNHEIKTLHEFKYSKINTTNNLFNKIKANKKIIWCLENKEINNIKYISLIDSSDEEGPNY